MRNDQAETVVQLVHHAIESRREAEARQVANGLIQGYIGPDHKVMNMQSFYSALVQALRAARMRGEDDSGNVLTLT
jgi:hypothetical protein